MADKLITSIIVDDEPHAVELLDILIRENCPQIKVIERASNVDEAYEKISICRPDVVFLDIKLRSQTSFQLLDRFEHIFFQVVFTTAYDHYALEAFQYSALHYLMKPIDVSQLEVTAKRLVSRMLHLQYQGNSESGEPDYKRLNKIAVSTNHSTEFIDLDNIEYLSAEGSYTKIHLLDNSTRLSSKILGHFQNILDPDKFCRTSRKYIVNVGHIQKLDKGKSLVLHLKSGTHIQVTAAYKDDLLKVLKQRVSF